MNLKLKQFLFGSMDEEHPVSRKIVPALLVEETVLSVSPNVRDGEEGTPLACPLAPLTAKPSRVCAGSCSPSTSSRGTGVPARGRPSVLRFGSVWFVFGKRTVSRGDVRTQRSASLFPWRSRCPRPVPAGLRLRGRLSSPTSVVVGRGAH